MGDDWGGFHDIDPTKLTRERIVDFLGRVEPEAILAHCRLSLSAYKLPHVVYQIAEIPRTGSGKIIRYKLREALTA